MEEKVRVVIKLQWTLLLIFVLCVPYYYANVSLLPQFAVLAIKYLPFAIVLLISITSSLYGCIKLGLDKLALILSVYSILCALTVWISVDVELSVARFVYYWCTGLFVFFLSSSTNFLTRDISYWNNVLIYTITLVSAYGVFTHVTGIDFLFSTLPAESLFYNYTWRTYPRVRAYSTLGNPMPYSAVISLFLPFLYSALLIIKDVSYKKVFLIIFPVIWWVGIIVSYSRAGLLTAFVTSFFWLLQYSYISDSKVSIKNLKYFICVILLIYVFIHIFNSYDGSILDRLIYRLDLLMTLSSSEAGRLNKYVVIFDLIKEKPLWGVGYGQVTEYLESLVETKRVIGAPTTDNQYLMILGETGIPGLLCFLIFLVYAFKIFFEHMVQRREITKLSVFNVSCLAMLAGLVFNMLTWDTLNNPTLRILIWFVIGLNYGLLSRSRE